MKVLTKSSLEELAKTFLVFPMINAKNGQTRVTNAKVAKAIAHICQVFENADALFDKQPAASAQCTVSAKKPQVAKQPADAPMRFLNNGPHFVV